MNVSLHLGDCLAVLPTLAAGSVSAVVTDPPYGVNFRQGKSSGGYGGAATRNHYRPIIGDDKPFDPSPFLSFPVVVLFGAHNYSDRLPASRGWVFWHKRAGMARNDFGDGELIWTNQDHVIRYREHMWSGILRASETGGEHLHPTQKPVALMAWLIEQYTKPGDTVLDPYMGTGATGVAAVQLGRNFVGCEISSTYFAIAQRRIADAQAQLTLPLFDAPPANRR